jgi:hypothetical protein
MMTIFGRGLLPHDALRPCFVYLANCEGAGKTLLVKTAVVPVLGQAPVGIVPKDEDELRKAIAATVREARSVLFLDNVKGHLSSEALESLLSAQTFSGRVLGVSETFTAPNLATVFVTGNGCTVSPDLRRRSLFCELFIEAERPEDRKFTRMLEVGELLQERERILSALWSLVQSWDLAGRPGPSKTSSSFPHWAAIVGGIVEHSGFGCPLDAPNITAGDVDGRDMHKLAELMVGQLTFDELVGISREHGLFSSIVSDEALDRRDKSRLGRLFSRFDRRLLGKHRFVITGAGHGRRYQCEALRSDP